MTYLSTSTATVLGEMRGWALAHVAAYTNVRYGDTATLGDHAREHHAIVAVFDELETPSSPSAARAALTYLGRAVRFYDDARKTDPFDADAYDDCLNALALAADAQLTATGDVTLGDFAASQAVAALLASPIADVHHPDLAPRLNPGAGAFRWHRWARTVCSRDHLSRAAKQLAPLLALYADGDGVCWPSHSQLMELSGMTRPTLRKGLRELERDQAFVIEREASGHGSTRYRLTTHEQDFAEVHQAAEVPF